MYQFINIMIVKLIVTLNCHKLYLNLQALLSFSGEHTSNHKPPVACGYEMKQFINTCTCIMYWSCNRLINLTADIEVFWSDTDDYFMCTLMYRWCVCVCVCVCVITSLGQKYIIIYTPQNKLRILFFFGVFFIIRDLSLQFNKKYPQK